MSDYNAGYNTAIADVLKMMEEHRLAHKRVANNFYGSERPDVAEGLEDWQVNDLKALARKVRRLKR